MDQDELLKLLAQAKAEKWSRLDLAGMDLEELPPQIGELPHLQTLVLGKIDYQTRQLKGNRLTKLPPEIGKLRSLTTLSLIGNQLRQLPVDIGQLTPLTDLYLSSNQLTHLPADIGQLISLTNLDLRYNQLTHLPADIGQLTFLNNLYLSNNQLTQLPTDIGQLTFLTTLNLRSNQLTHLPKDIGKLTSLNTLDLNENHLTHLPKDIGKLTSLTSLDLSYNQLTQLPEDIGKLTSLTTLNLNENQLTQLPKDIGKLTSLTTLDLRSNQLTQLPSEIGQLTSLTRLYLRYNQLHEVPSEIGQLTSLTRLYLNYNQLHEVPSEIGQLTSLTRLYLSDNQLREVPGFLQELPNLKQLDLRGNPLPIPTEILGPKEPWENPGDISRIFNFYFNTQRKAEPFYEAKLILVGDGGAGKTTLANKLQDPDYDLEQAKRTEGIDVTPWDIQHPDGYPYRINLWDFGGQDIYHATHQFFLTKRSIYVLVHDNREGKTDFYYWLRLVELLSDGSPVLLVKNRKEGCHGNIDEGSLRKQFSTLKESHATNLKTNKGLEEAQKLIQEYLCNRLPHIGQPIPAHWASIRAVLENMSSTRNYIDIKEYKTLCRQSGFNDEQDMLYASQFLHDLGICLHFQKDRFLSKYLILKPTWATDSIYKIFENDTVRDDFGHFNDVTLETLWDEKDEAEMRDELLLLMKNFELCYEIPSAPGNYIAPHLLEDISPKYHWDETDNLILSYFYPFKPKQIFPSFIVNLHNKIDYRTTDNQALVWKHGVILTNGHTRAEIIEDEHYRNAHLKIRVSGADKRGFLTVIAHELEKIQNSYGSGDTKLDYETRIPCNCTECKGSQHPNTYTWAHLERRLRRQKYRFECELSFEFVDVRSLITDVTTGSPLTPEGAQRHGNRPSLFHQTHSDRGDNVGGHKVEHHHHY